MRYMAYPLLGKESSTLLFKWRMIVRFGKKSELNGSGSFR